MTAFAVELIVVLAIVTALAIVNYKMVNKMEKEDWKEMKDAENEYMFRNYPIGCGPLLF